MSKRLANNNIEIIPPPYLQANDRLGRFVLGRRISEGPLFHLYQAHDPLRDRDVCLKLANASCQLAKTFLESEFRITNMFAACENIIDVYDIHQFEYGPAQITALSTEYAPEGSLADWLRNNRSNIDLRRQEGRRFLAELVNIFDLIQSKGSFLPDFDPANFMLIDGHLKLANLMSLADFYLLSNHAEDSPRNPHYMAPECFVATESTELSIASIVYSLAILVYAIFSDDARPPFEGSYEQLKEKHRFLEPPPLAIDPGLEKVIRRCLDKSAAKRPQDVDELKEALAGRSDGIVSEDESELAVLCTKLVDTMNQGNVQQACVLCQKALDRAPGRSDLLELKGQLEPIANQVCRYLEELRMNINQQDINSSLEMLNRAVQLNGGATEEMQNVAGLLGHRYTECHKYAQHGQAAAAQQNWPLALDYFERAWQMNCCDLELTNWRTLLSDIVETKRGMEMSMQSSNEQSALYFAEKLDGLIGGINGSESE